MKCCKCYCRAKLFTTLHCLNKHRCYLTISKEEPPMKKCKPNSAETTKGKFIYLFPFICLIRVRVSCASRLAPGLLRASFSRQLPNQSFSTTHIIIFAIILFFIFRTAGTEGWFLAGPN